MKIFPFFRDVNFLTYQKDFRSIFIEWDSFLADAYICTKRFVHLVNVWTSHHVRLAVFLYDGLHRCIHVDEDQPTHSGQLRIFQLAAFEGDKLICLGRDPRAIRARTFPVAQPLLWQPRFHPFLSAVASAYTRMTDSLSLRDASSAFWPVV